MDNILIKLCRAFADGEQVTLDGEIDYKELYSLSKSHNLSPVIFCVLNTAQNRDIVPRESLKAFENDFLDAVALSDFQSALTAEIDALYEKENIRHVFFKGAAIRELFPVPEARVMTDIDVLIDLENRDRVKKLLIENGFRCENSNGNVYEYTKNGLLCEVHTKIISGKIGSSDVEAAFSDAINHAEFDGARGTLDDDYHTAYLIAHIAHHFWFYGAGVKMLLDLAVILKRAHGKRNIDHGTFVQRLSRLGGFHTGEFFCTLLNQLCRTKHQFAACFRIHSRPIR